jgi:H+-translocating NAD(P) transhydrogenase subunit beta
MAEQTIIRLAYLLAAVLFILGLKGLTHPKSAVRGNKLGALGMLIAVVAVLLSQEVISYGQLAIGLGIGAVLGAILAVKIQMTAMPQLVAIFNGFGGIASAFVAAASYEAVIGGVPFVDMLAADPLSQSAATTSVSVAAAGLVGAVTFTGSLVAFAKLQELIKKKPAWVPSGRIVNGLLLLVALGLAGWMVVEPSTPVFWAMLIVSAVLGLSLVLPIGGADMPVVIALLNSYSGLAAAAAGFVLQNTALIISGSLVGSSGLILTTIMCKAMNRSLANVLFGGMGGGGATVEGPSADEVYAGKIKSTSAEEVAMMLESANRVVIVPGYGMAVAQAQHAVRDLMSLLQAQGSEVEFGIHPVAGRMPGHMNVLLAESDVPYDLLREMEIINPTFPQTDVTIVIGANDVVNPDAREVPDSPIAGMPILEVDKSRTVIVIKRSLSPGFAGVPNPLFARDNTMMLFGHGKEAILDIVTALKEG